MYPFNIYKLRNDRTPYLPEKIPTAGFCRTVRTHKVNHLWPIVNGTLIPVGLQFELCHTQHNDHVPQAVVHHHHRRQDLCHLNRLPVRCLLRIQQVGKVPPPPLTGHPSIRLVQSVIKQYSFVICVRLKLIHLCINSNCSLTGKLWRFTRLFIIAG